MLYCFGFDRIGVVLGDLYFVDPNPDEGQAGAEHGVRLEVRLLEAGDPNGSIYAARPITIGMPIWRADLLESVAGPVGSFDRAHHHARCRGWEPGGRSFEPELSTDPVGFVAGALGNLGHLVEMAGLPASVIGPDDARALREAVPEITTTLTRLLERVRAGELGVGPPCAGTARIGWL